MMKTAKRITALLCILALALSLTACGQGKPDAVVEDFCKAAQQMDIDAMAAQLKSPSAERFQEEMSGAFELIGPMMDVLKAHAANMTYTITESTVDDTHATVMVDFVLDDLAPVIKQTVVLFLPHAIELSISGQRPTEEALLAQLMEDFTLADAQVEVGTVTASVKFTCLNTKDNGWKIADIDDTALRTALSQNFDFDFDDYNLDAELGDKLEEQIRQQIAQRILEGN